MAKKGMRGEGPQGAGAPMNRPLGPQATPAGRKAGSTIHKNPPDSKGPAVPAKGSPPPLK